ncbi:hypothetical protein ACJX0J_019185, partial [Zea mays]
LLIQELIIIRVQIVRRQSLLLFIHLCDLMYGACGLVENLRTCIEANDTGLEKIELLFSGRSRKEEEKTCHGNDGIVRRPVIVYGHATAVHVSLLRASKPVGHSVY